VEGGNERKELAVNHVLLLGAGASADAGIPVSHKLTKELLDTFQTDTGYKQVLQFIVGGLIFRTA
jgi:hypothetical protein